MKTFKQITAIIISPIMIPLLAILSVCSMWNGPRETFFDDIIDVTHSWWLVWIFRDTII